METKLFNAFEDRPPIRYRPGTSDEHIIQALLVEKKEYVFPKFEPRLIFDIGSNIGVVSIILANVYPQAKIYCFEPIRENFDLLKENVVSYENVFPMQVALGNRTEDRRIYKSDDPTNFGGFSTHISNQEDPGTLISVLDVEKLCDKIGTPDLIKIDCEGAEHEILTSIPGLKQVKWITGELHGIKDYALLERLDRDFRLQLSRGFGDKVWHFHALSKSWVDFGLDLPPRQ